MNINRISHATHIIFWKKFQAQRSCFIIYLVKELRLLIFQKLQGCTSIPEHSVGILQTMHLN